MKIIFMTYNILHGLNCTTGKTDHEAFSNIIKKYGADIIGLNEAREGSELDNAHEIAHKLGFYSCYAKAVSLDDNNFHGNALLSRFPIEYADIIPIPDPKEKNGNLAYETRCILRARINAGTSINVFVTHFGLNEDEQINGVKAVVENLCPDCILMGDFNTVPTDKNLDPIREKLFDTAEHFKAPMLSFPSYAPDRRIDYIFADKKFNIISADIPPETVSDHRPHIAVIEIPG